FINSVIERTNGKSARTPICDRFARSAIETVGHHHEALLPVEVVGGEGFLFEMFCMRTAKIVQIGALFADAITIRLDDSGKLRVIVLPDLLTVPQHLQQVLLIGTPSLQFENMQVSIAIESENIWLLLILSLLGDDEELILTDDAVDVVG